MPQTVDTSTWTADQLQSELRYVQDQINWANEALASMESTAEAYADGWTSEQNARFQDDRSEAYRDLNRLEARRKTLWAQRDAKREEESAARERASEQRAEMRAEDYYGGFDR